MEKNRMNINNIKFPEDIDEREIPTDIEETEIEELDKIHVLE